MMYPLLLLLSVPLQSVVAIDLKPVWSLDVLPEELAKTGYWHKEYNDRCGVDMLEAHGTNAALSFNFYGSGIVARLLTCEACSEVEIQIDKLAPITVDLSDRGFKCPTSSPVFVKTDLEEGAHTVTLKHLDETRDLKVMKLEYLTSKLDDESNQEEQPNGEESEQPPLFDASPSITKSAAREIAKAAIRDVAKYTIQQAIRVAASYVLMAAIKFVLEHMAGPGASSMIPDGAQAATSSSTPPGEGVDLGGVVAKLTSEWANNVEVSGEPNVNGAFLFQSTIVQQVLEVNADAHRFDEADIMDLLLDIMHSFGGTN